MLVVEKETEFKELVVNKSKFISQITPCESLSLLKQKLTHLSKEPFNNASHIVYALRAKNDNDGIDAYFSDDGEPSGTAGKPLLNILEGRSMINTAVLVIRYYGGINLGTGGLVKAYSEAAQMSLEAAKFIKYMEYNFFKIILKYNILEQFIKLVSNIRGEVVEKKFDDNVTLHLKLPKGQELHLESFLKANQLDMIHV
ncbi:YigZ family protein [Methylophilaceae bacterium]|nr:YigZ family protein [Methylophilaceae bacterium]